MAVYCIKCEAMNHADAVRCSLCGWDLLPDPPPVAVAASPPEKPRGAHVVATSHEAERDTDYRLPDDPPHIIRINQSCPDSAFTA